MENEGTIGYTKLPIADKRWSEVREGASKESHRRRANGLFFNLPWDSTRARSHCCGAYGSGGRRSIRKLRRGRRTTLIRNNTFSIRVDIFYYFFFALSEYTSYNGPFHRDLSRFNRPPTLLSNDGSPFLGLGATLHQLMINVSSVEDLSQWPSAELFFRIPLGPAKQSFHVENWTLTRGGVTLTLRSDPGSRVKRRN